MKQKRFEKFYEISNQITHAIRKLISLNAIQVLSVSLILILLFGCALSLIFFIKAYPSEGLNFDFTDTGFEYFKSQFGTSVVLVEATFKFLVSVSTIGGIFIAVKSYYANQYSSSISNHISNIKTFSEFIFSEVEKLPLVSQQSISAFFWYNEVFPDSKLGSLRVSPTYLTKLEKINRVIEASNRVYSSSEKPDFSYQIHQTNLINALKGVGVEMARLSRNDFHACETEVLKLIDLTNLEFCGIKDERYLMKKRAYI